jgi:hypothetical protein
MLYYLGDRLSRPMLRYDLGWIYPCYSKLMVWSSDLDNTGEIWKTPSMEPDPKGTRLYENIDC